MLSWAVPFYLLACLMALSLTDSASAEHSVTIGISSWIGNGPLLVATHFGLFKKYGVKVSLIHFNNSSDVLDAVASGNLDGATPSLDQVVLAASHGMPIKIVMPLDVSKGADAIIAKDDIANVSALSGHKIVYEYDSPSELLLAYALAKNGVNMHSIRGINTPAGYVPAALASGSVAVGVTWQPHVSQALALDGGKEFHVVFSSKNALGLISDTLVFNTTFINRNPKDILGVIQGYLAGLSYIEHNNSEAMNIIANGLGVTDETAKEDYSGVENIPLSKMPSFFKNDSSLWSYYSTGNIIFKILINDGILNKSHIPPIANIVDDKFVARLEQK